MKRWILYRYYCLMIAWHRAGIFESRRCNDMKGIMFHARKELEFTRKRYTL